MLNELFWGGVQNSTCLQVTVWLKCYSNCLDLACKVLWNNMLLFYSASYLNLKLKALFFTITWQLNSLALSCFSPSHFSPCRTALHFLLCGQLWKRTPVYFNHIKEESQKFKVYYIYCRTMITHCIYQMLMVCLYYWLRKRYVTSQGAVHTTVILTRVVIG